MTPRDARRLRLACRAGVALVLLCLLAAPFAARVGVDNRLELWVAPEGEQAERYARFREDFGSDEFLLVAFAGEWLTQPALAAQERALERLEALPHVRRVSGPPAVRRDLLEDPDDLEALREELLATPFYRRFLVSATGEAAGLLVETALPPEPTARAELVRGARAALAPLRDAGLEAHLVGPPVLNVALDELSRREGARTFPVAFTLSLALVALAFRALRPALVAGACAGAALLLTFGAMGAAGRSLNLVTAVLPALLWVLALAGTLHLLARERAHRAAGRSPRAALAAALAEVAGPCAMAAVTTALGFASLLAADMRPVRELGAFAALGVLIGLLVQLTLAPALVRAIGPGSGPAPGPAPGRAILERVGLFATAHPRGVIAGAAAAVVLVALSLPHLRVESDPLSFLPRTSETARAYAFVAEQLTGFYSLELVVDTPESWLAPEVWPPLDALQEAVGAEPGVARVLSPLDFLRHLHALSRGRADGSYRLPEDEGAATRSMRLYDAFGGGQRTRLVAEGGRRVRLSALVDVMPSGAFRSIVDGADRALASLPPGYSGHTTGVVLRLVDAQLGLVESQLRSFGLAFATVFACVGAGLRSLRLLLVSVLPNLLPVAAAFAAMVALGIALDAATVMMASVALGIAVDDTVHLLSAYRRGRRGPASRGAAARAALGEVGPAMWVTTAASCVGFAALLTSSFAPIRWFGALATLALAVALLADAVVVPALLTTGLGRLSR